MLHNIAINQREPMYEGEIEAEELHFGTDYAGREDGRNVRDYISKNFFSAFNKKITNTKKSVNLILFSDTRRS